MAAAADVLGIRLQRVDVRGAADLDGAVGTALRQCAEALVVYPLTIHFLTFSDRRIRGQEAVADDHDPHTVC
jgi:hypothetical protein